MKKLETLTVQQLCPGMRVASVLLDENGLVLLPAGTELSGGVIASLQRWGIQEVAVEQEVEDVPAALERHRQQVEAQLERLFRNAGEGSETRSLYKAVSRYRLERQP